MGRLCTALKEGARGGTMGYPTKHEGAGGRPRYEPASALGVRCLPILRSSGRRWDR